MVVTGHFLFYGTPKPLTHSAFCFEKSNATNPEIELIHHLMLQKLNQSHRGFTLVEVMIVMAIIVLLASIAVPNYLRARKRSQATRSLQDLRMIDSAIDQYAVEYNRPPGTALNWVQVQTYIKTGTPLYVSNGVDLFGNSYGSMIVDSIPKVPDATFNALSDIAPSGFWSPYK